MKTLNETQMKALAAKYEAAQSNENDAETRRVYALFVKECEAQFSKIPCKVIFTESDPYQNSAEMFADVDAGRLHVYTGGEKHPLLTKRENSIFRAVHDYFGHYATRGNFKPAGEFKAWLNHSAMFTPDARRALDTETIAQVAVYFFGSNPGKFAVQKAVLL